MSNLNTGKLSVQEQRREANAEIRRQQLVDARELARELGICGGDELESLYDGTYYLSLLRLTADQVRAVMTTVREVRN